MKIKNISGSLNYSATLCELGYSHKECAGNEKYYEELPFAEEYDNDIAPVKENVKENANDKVNDEPVIEINNK